MFFSFSKTANTKTIPLMVTELKLKYHKRSKESVESNYVKVFWKVATQCKTINQKGTLACV